MFNKRQSKCGKNQNQALFVRSIDDSRGILLMSYYKLLFYCFSYRTQRPQSELEHYFS